MKIYHLTKKGHSIESAKRKYHHTPQPTIFRLFYKYYSSFLQTLLFFFSL